MALSCVGRAALQQSISHGRTMISGVSSFMQLRPEYFLPQIGNILWDFILRAVPKSKVLIALPMIFEYFPNVLFFTQSYEQITPSRKRMRGFHRAPEKVTGYSSCPECGGPKLRHRLCLCWEARIRPSYKHGQE